MMLLGKGWYIWQLYAPEIGSPAQLAGLAAGSGVTHLLVKVANGIAPFNLVNVNGQTVDLVPELIAECRRVGIQVWGWQYVYGIDPANEARIALKRCNELDLSGFIVDAEGEYKKAGAAAAERYMHDLRAGLPGLPIALSSFRWPSVHPEFPWDAFAKHVDLMMPQVYWVQANNPANQLEQSVLEYSRRWGSLPYIPTGAAYHEDGWQSTPEQITAFYNKVKDMGLPACNFWEWANALRYGLWDAVAQLGGSVLIDPPAPEPEPIPTRARVLTNILNLRPRPQVDQGKLGQLFKDTEAEVLEVKQLGDETWAHVHIDGWIAVDYHGQHLSEVM